MAWFSERWTLELIQFILLAALFTGPLGGFPSFGLRGLAALLSALLPLLPGLGAGIYLAVALQGRR